MLITAASTSNCKQRLFIDDIYFSRDLLKKSLRKLASSSPCRPEYQAWHRASVAARLAVHRLACMHRVALVRLQHLHHRPHHHHPVKGVGGHAQVKGGGMARRLKCAANLLAPTHPRRNALRAKWPATAVPRVRRSTGVSNRTATRPSATCWRP